MRYVLWLCAAKHARARYGYGAMAMAHMPHATWMVDGLVWVCCLVPCCVLLVAAIDVEYSRDGRSRNRKRSVAA